MMAFTALCRWLIEWKDGVSQIIPLISLRASERRRGVSGNAETGMQGPARAPAGAGGPLGYLGGAGGGMLGGGGGEPVQPPQAACAAHPGAVVSWSLSPAARQRLI